MASLHITLADPDRKMQGIFPQVPLAWADALFFTQCDPVSLLRVALGLNFLNNHTGMALIPLLKGRRQPRKSPCPSFTARLISQVPIWGGKQPPRDAAICICQDARMIPAAVHVPPLCAEVTTGETSGSRIAQRGEIMTLLDKLPSKWTAVVDFCLCVDFTLVACLASFLVGSLRLLLPTSSELPTLKYPYIPM